MNKCLLTPDTEPLTVQVRILSKSSLVTQIVSLGLFPGVWVRAYLWKQSLQGARLVSASSRRLTLSESVSQQPYY